MKRAWMYHWIGMLAAVAAIKSGAATGILSGPFAHDNLQIFLVHGDTQLEQRRYVTPTTLMFETLDMDAGGVWIHKSFINKGSDRVVVPLDSNSTINQEIVEPSRGR